MQEINAREAADKLASDPDNIVLLDVRETYELEVARVSQARHIAMGEIPDRIAELDPKQTIICMCHHGGRSAQVAGWLASQGYTRVINMAGGINGWSELVDPEVPVY
jgi:rhodanese-related sulfurtransferase